jgi:hypothetical protein
MISAGPGQTLGARLLRVQRRNPVPVAISHA